MLHFHKTSEFICIGAGGGGGGGVSTYNFMLYMIGRRLINSLLTRFMRTHAFFLFCRQCCRSFPCYLWSLVNVLTMVVLIGNYKKKFFTPFPFWLAQTHA